MRFVFHADAWNDFDHMAPIMLTHLQRQKEGTGGVLLIQLMPGEPIDHPMMSVLSDFSGFECVRPTRLQALRHRLLVENRVIRKLTGRNRFLKTIQSVLLKWWPNRMLKGGDVCIYGYGSARRLNAEEALRRGIPVVCVPHGYNVFTNYAINDHILGTFDKTGKWPDFSERNAFTKYIVNSEQSRRHMIDWGVRTEIVENWGSARFCPAYAFSLLKMNPVYEFPELEQTSVRVSLFLPHLDYNVYLDDLLDLLQILVQDQSISLVVKTHTRLSKISSEAAAFMDALIGIEKTFPNLHIESPANSAAVVHSSDAVIVFGSSIAIEALLQHKPLIYPIYLDTNATIFDEGQVANTATTHAECLTLVSFVGDQDVTLFPRPNSLDDFLDNYIYGSDRVDSIADAYVDRLEELCTYWVNSTGVRQQERRT